MDFYDCQKFGIYEAEKEKNSFMLSIEEAENTIGFSDINSTEERIVLEAAFRVLNMEERQIVILHVVVD